MKAVPLWVRSKNPLVGVMTSYLNLSDQVKRLKEAVN
jgi:hypothetical protein